MVQKTSSIILGIASVTITSILLTGCTLAKRQPVPLPLEQAVDVGQPGLSEENPNETPKKSGDKLPTAAPKVASPTPTLGATDINSLEKDLGELELDAESF